MDIPVYSMAGQVVDHVTVDESALGGKPNMDLVRQAIIMYEANKRVGTAKTKRRDEISASNRKMWRQKHTGRARHSTRASPLWVGGGVAHGPQPRDFRQKMNKAARRKALYSAFLAKAIDGEVMVVDRLELPKLKTREMVAVLRNLGIDRTFLIVPDRHDPDLWRCTRNIRGAAMTTARDLNAYGMIRPKRVIFTLAAIRQFLDEADSAGKARPEARQEVEVGEDG